MSFWTGHAFEALLIRVFAWKSSTRRAPLTAIIPLKHFRAAPLVASSASAGTLPLTRFLGAVNHIRDGPYDNGPDNEKLHVHMASSFVSPSGRIILAVSVSLQENVFFIYNNIEFHCQVQLHPVRAVPVASYFLSWRNEAGYTCLPQSVLGRDGRGDSQPAH